MKKVARIFIAAVFCASLALGVAWAKAQEKCPVMGAPVNKSVYVDHNGKRIYFCCAGCPETFKKDPDKYLKQMAAEGVELEDAPAAAAKPAGETKQ